MSLRVRIFSAMAAVAVASVVVTALLTRGGVQRVVEAYVLGMPPSPTAAEAVQLAALEEGLVARWSPGTGFVGADVVLRAFRAETDRGSILVDRAGEVVAVTGVALDSVRATAPDSDGGVTVEWTAGEGGRRRLQGGIPLRRGGEGLVGAVVILPESGFGELPTGLGPRGAIDRRIAAAAGAAVLLALVASLFLARHVADPVARLARATRRLADGDRSERIVSRRTDEVGRLVAAFNHLADSLERSEGLRRRLVADVAHELRTPLAALQGSIEAMQDGLSAPDARGLQSLHADVAHLADLVTELQDLALAEAGQLRLEREPVELMEETRRAARALGLGPDGGPEGPHFVLTGEPVRVVADPRRIRQILTNLLSNAVHHGRPRTIRVAVSGRGSRGVVEVADDGIGIEPEALPHIFERLYRADVRHPGRPGSGLGLAITRELVRMHGGTISVSSTPGRGTTFEVELPVAPA